MKVHDRTKKLDGKSKSRRYGRPNRAFVIDQQIRQNKEIKKWMT